ncbi:1,3-beta-glucanosyltransferase [Friedmanniomyces endolithicus]|nr:1,3-beta-glucanosyltransferase [Friedmanniomyces endolithicus]KAK0772982.1 1,3-beta-glucanosyltransferase [Friedmanniomyces endolithicus]KAK0776941.1 1,3-beta-glucanosyltransferase [Friedmanniomyces endolithicus]
MPKSSKNDKPTPASVPIVTRGNAFWRDGERFFVKGIAYVPRSSNRERGIREDSVDPLSDAHLPELKEDVALIRNLGLNSISLYNVDSSKDHSQAMAHLEENGIYVTVKLFNDLEAPTAMPKNESNFKAKSATWPMYDNPLVTNAFRLVHNLSRYPNLLGFVVSGRCMHTPQTIPMAEVLRACIRDTKAFLRSFDGVRQIPVGVSADNTQTSMIAQVRYFSAGLAAERADFMAKQCYSWAGPSSFTVSGWQNMVERIGPETMMPMLMGEYGAKTRKSRPWDEVTCLYSPHMTSVYSGGFAYTYLENGNNYGVVKIDEEGKRVIGQEYKNLKKRFKEVNGRSAEDVASEEVKPYEQWVGEFPPCDTRWQATSEIPPFPGNWDAVIRNVLGDLAPLGS